MSAKPCVYPCGTQVERAHRSTPGAEKQHASYASIACCLQLVKRAVVLQSPNGSDLLQ